MAHQGGVLSACVRGRGRARAFPGWVARRKPRSGGFWRPPTSDRIGVATIWKKAPGFDRTMAEVLMVFREVNLQNDRRTRPSDAGREDLGRIIIAGIDKKACIQAIASTAPD